MISIIICSTNPSLLKQVSDNINNTIGVPYEIIAIDNKDNVYGICEAYNLGASGSKFEYLVFCHEDILFHTSDWGKVLVDLLQKKEIGLVGISGAIFKSSAPAPWISIPTKYYRSNLNNYKFTSTDLNIVYDEVSVIDGCFISCTKENWKIVRFSESLLKGFHLYDIDFSWQFRHKRNIVSYKISISHFSDGNFDEKWFQESFLYFKKMKSYFPIFTKEVRRDEIRSLDAFAWKSLFYLLKKTKISKRKLLMVIYNHLIIKPFSLENLRFLKHFW